MLARELPLVADEHTVVESVVNDGTGFLAVEFDKTQKLTVGEITADVTQCLPSWYIAAAKRLCTKVKNRKLRQWLLPLPGHTGIFKLPLKLMRKLERASARRSIAPILPATGDILLLPDAYWSQLDIWQHVACAWGVCGDASSRLDSGNTSSVRGRRCKSQLLRIRPPVCGKF